MSASTRNGCLAEALAELSAEEVERLYYDWEVWARADQLPPTATSAGEPWRVWLVLGGRGSGKTRAGAEWVRAKALCGSGAHERSAARIALVGETLGAFVYGVLTTNSYDADAIRETSKLEMLGTRRQLLEVRLKGWIGAMAERLEVLIHAEPALANHAFFLRLMAQQSRFLMSEEMEALAAELCLDAGQAFGRLLALAHLLVFAAKLPKDFAGLAAGETLREVRGLSDPARADGRIVFNPLQELLDVVTLLGHLAERLQIGLRRTG